MTRIQIKCPNSIALNGGQKEVHSAEVGPVFEKSTAGHKSKLRG